MIFRLLFHLNKKLKLIFFLKLVHRQISNTRDENSTRAKRGRIRYDLFDVRRFKERSN